jgi:hypothetical protein
LIGFVCLWPHLLPALARAGSLQDVEDAASDAGNDRDDQDDESDEGSHSDSGGYVESTSYGSSSEDEGPSTLELIFLAPWTLPRHLIDDPCLMGYAQYPYRDGVGLLRRAPVKPECIGTQENPLAESRAFAAQTDFEAGYVLHDIVAGTFAARLQMPQRLEIDGRISLMQDLKARPHEQALSGTTHLTMRFAQSAGVDFRTGIGLRAFGLHKPLYGFDLMYGMDMYAGKPLLVHLELHLGNLGRAVAAQARATIGVQIWKLELYAGYDHTFFAGATQARVGGPVLGLRAWF